MRCIICKTSFSDNDAIMIQRDNDTPICDNCTADTVEIHLKYDGNCDLLEYLRKHTPKNRFCGCCLSSTVELTSIIFGNPIEGYTQCKSCKMESEIYIYLEMV